MKKIILLFAITLSVFSLTAQNASEAPNTSSEVRKGRGKGHSKGQHAANTLNLSKEQKTKMKGIADVHKGKIQAIRTDKSLSKEQKMAKMKELNTSHEAEMKGVLSAEQYTKWTEMKTNRKGKMKGNMKGEKGKGTRKAKSTEGGDN